MSDWNFLNKHRVGYGRFATTASDGFNGAFTFAIPGESRRICVIASDGEGWRHVSVSFGQISPKCPSWEVMCRVKDLFFEPTDWVVQFHPPASEYVNNHPGCLHLWQPTEATLPTPDAMMVGIKGAGIMNEETARAARDKFLRENR